MLLHNPRIIHLLIVFSVIGLMSYALYTQYVGGLVPCPLCITQRLFYCLIGGFALIAAIDSNRYKIYSMLIALSAFGGILTAGQQTRLQHLPPELVPACGPSLEYMLETFPFTETLKSLILGDGNCAEIDWIFMGLSMAEWSLICFIGFFCVSIWQILHNPIRQADD